MEPVRHTRRLRATLEGWWLMRNVAGALGELRAAYTALRRAGHDGANVALQFVPVLARSDLRRRRGRDVTLSCCATPAASVQFARMRAAWEMLPGEVRAKAHLILAVERGG